MSRIGKLPIAVPEGTEIKLDGSILSVRGPKGSLTHTIPEGISIQVEDGSIHVRRDADTKRIRALHGLTRSLVANMVTGVTQGFEKQLQIVGVGYRGSLQGKTLQLSLGYSHPIFYPVPEGIEIAMDDQTRIVVKGIDKQKVGQVAAEIRSFRKPEPYKGKGISYVGEQIRRKAGKSKG